TEINKDPLRSTAYNFRKVLQLHVTIINASTFTAMTGLPTPPSPVRAKSYLESKLPWFEIYDVHIPVTNASSLPGILTTKVNLSVRCCNVQLFEEEDDRSRYESLRTSPLR
ncbi:hypothetical protein CVT25_002782, partial [Psilocybe cyanescens]